MIRPYDLPDTDPQIGATMKVQDDKTGLDLPATHIECLTDGETFDLKEYGYDIDARPVDSILDVHCPNAEGDEDHPIELQHIADKPVLSPDAVKRDNVIVGDPWRDLSDFDNERWDFGTERFVYALEG